ncbi:MAG: phage portal protein, partial [Pseudomonadota bacterium]
MPQGAVGPGTLPRTSYHYRQDVGEGLDSNVIMAPVMWIMRTFTEAHATVERRTPESVWATVEDHEAGILMDRPNEAYDGDALWKATCVSYVLNGNAYWRKVRNVFGDVIQLWYVPHWLVQPRWPQDGSQFIGHYDYQPNSGLGGPTRLLPRDVVHFRFGLDPRNPRLGFSPLQPLLREIFTDDEAANFSAKILQNMGVPGLLVSPKSDAYRPSDDDLEKLKAYMATAFTGDQRGGAMVMGMPTDVAQFGFDPNKLMLGNLRDIAEERVCAALGLPAAVVGFGSGLQSTKVGATMRELRRLAWVQCLMPTQKSLARQLTAQLLPDFVAQLRRFRIYFDTSDVSAFQEEDDLRAARVARLVTAGVLRVDRGQEMLGLEVDDTQKVYLRPSNSLPVGPDAPAQPVPPGAVAPDPAAQNGNGTDPAAVDPAAAAAEGKLLAAIAERRGFTRNGHG